MRVYGGENGTVKFSAEGGENGGIGGDVFGDETDAAGLRGDSGGSA